VDLIFELGEGRYVRSLLLAEPQVPLFSPFAEVKVLFGRALVLSVIGGDCPEGIWHTHIFMHA